VKLQEIEAHRRYLLAQRRFDPDEACVIGSRVHLAMHYIARAQGLRFNSLCHCCARPFEQYWSAWGAK
jgi:hypothetical protein